MKLTRFRALSGVLILLLVAAIAGQWWGNSTHETLTLPTLRYSRAGQFGGDIPWSPQQAPTASNGNRIPPDAKPLHFNGGTFYILPIS